jgi:hypothetical protein
VAGRAVGATVGTGVGGGVGARVGTIVGTGVGTGLEDAVGRSVGRGVVGNGLGVGNWRTYDADDGAPALAKRTRAAANMQMATNTAAPRAGSIRCVPSPLRASLNTEPVFGKFDQVLAG